MTKIKSYFSSEAGATAIEYGLIAMFISLGVAATIFVFGDELNNLFFSQLTGMFGQ
jgi:Flp pilus assembly pilin Flp